MAETAFHQMSSRAILLTGHRMSRRDFIKAAGLTSAAVVAGAAIPARALAQSEAADVVDPTEAIDAVASLSARLGHDPESIFRFVSEQVRYEPYAGLLRGPWVALAGRAGNSVDQAALLTLLLRHAGVETRYAWGALDQATADSLLQTAIVDVDSVRQEAVEALSGALPGEEAEVAPALPAETQARLAQADERQADVATWTRSQLDDTLGIISRALEDAGVAPAGGLATVPALEIGQHVWVQALLDGSDWVDLDPSLPTNAPGDLLAAADATAASLPEELFHQIEFAVIAEALDGAGATTSELLRVVAPVWELSREPITFFNAGPEATPTLAQSFSMAAGIRQYVPILALGDSAFAGTPMRFPAPAADGGGLGGGFFTPETLEGEATAEWLEVRVLSPDRESEVVRRTVFDRVDPLDRSTGTFAADRLRPTEAVPVGPDGAAEVDVAMPLWWLSVSAGMPDIASNMPSTEEESSPALLALAHHLATEMAGVSVAAQTGVRTFVDGPNVTAITMTPSADLALDRTGGLGVDILRRSRGIAPIEGASPIPTAAAVPGVIAHLAERLLLGEGLAEAEASGALVSVGAVFDAAERAGIDMRVFAMPDQADEAGYSPEATARLRDSVANGRVAVAPAQPVTIGGRERIGWWLVDPATGRVSDEMDDGRGSTEYQVTWNISVNEIYALRAAQEAARIRCIIGLAFAMLSLVVAIGGFGAAVINYGSPEYLLSLAISAAGSSGALASMVGCV